MFWQEPEVPGSRNRSSVNYIPANYVGSSMLTHFELTYLSLAQVCFVGSSMLPQLEPTYFSLAQVLFVGSSNRPADYLSLAQVIYVFAQVMFSQFTVIHGNSRLIHGDSM